MASQVTTQPPSGWTRRTQSVWLEIGFGCLSGTAIFLWTHQFLATFGASIPATSALAVVIGLGLATGLMGRRWLTSDVSLRWSRPVGWLVIAAWTAAFPTLLTVATSVLGVISVSAMTSEATAFSMMLVIASGLLVAPVAACVLIAESLLSPRGRNSSTGVSPWSLLGAAVGLMAAPAALAPTVGLPVMVGAITLAAAAAFWRSLVTVPERFNHRPAAPVQPHSLMSWVLGLSLLIGLQLPGTFRLAQRVLPGSPFEHFALWAGLIGGIAIGLIWAGRAGRQNPFDVSGDGPLVAAIIALIWPLIVLAGWGWLVDGLLSVNATVSFVPLVMAIRMTVAATVAAPMGAALGRVWGMPGVTRSAVAVGVLCAVLSAVLMGSAGVPPTTAISMLALIAMSTAIGRYWSLELPRLGRHQQAAGILGVLCIAALPVLQGNYRPDVAARLLFSTQAFSAVQSGISRDLLPYLDDARLVATEEGRQSTWTIWKQRGSQLALRRNGLPRGVLSIDPETSPQFAGEVMPAVLPMILHEQPRSVLMLGLGSTASLTSVLACPVESVTCLEEDADLIHIVDTVLSPRAGRNPLDDDRVTLLNVSPALAIHASGQQYDVVIVNESQPSVLFAAAGFTREFYQAARQSLAQHGLLCQRLQNADFGRMPIEDLLATLRSVFPQVALYDSAPGEMLLVATPSSAPLVTEQTIDRCEALHIRQLMAQVGWDWSVLMNLGAISPEQVSELTAQRGTPNTVTNGRFAYGLPQEVMRWSSTTLPKWQERQLMLNEHASRMLTWLGESSRVREVNQRLADVIEQQRLITVHPDHFWAYRKTLKERLSERPRSAIQQVKHEGLKRSLHPEDKRRKQYLEVLGAAATSKTPDRAQVRALDEFAVPYDPLVSYFLHQEAARLYEKTPVDDPLARLQHWRYSVYFGPPADQSVRNVIAALDVVNEHPDVIADPVARWDEMNSLLEVLKQRSTLRLRTDNTASSFELVDAERSIAVAKRTMAAMDDLCAEAGVPQADWQRRRTVLERMLVRPMWTYHSQQAARLAKRQAQGKMIAAEQGGETEIR